MYKTRSILSFVALLMVLSSWAWAGDDPTLRVISVDPPPPYSFGDTPPSTVVVDFNQPVLPSSLDWTVFGISYSAQLTSPTQITLNVSPDLHPSRYYLTLFADLDYLNDYTAQLLALELGDELTAPPDLVEEISHDLAAIRTANLEMTAIQARPPWVPGELFLRLNSYGIAMYESGTFHELYALNEIYGPVSMHLFSLIPTLHLEFENLYNPEHLAPIYLIDGVDTVNPVGLVGDGADIAADPPHYTFSYGWGDCPAGCIYRHYWEYVVNDGTAVLLNEFGDPMPVTLSPRVVAGENLRLLDGEYNGSFPSGDGIDGGSFTIHWGWCDLFLEGRDPTMLHYVDGVHVVTGLLSDLRSSGTFDGASCLGSFAGTPQPDPLPDPPPGEARYFVVRGTDECAAAGYGESTLSPDPRDALMGRCFPGGGIGRASTTASSADGR